MSLVVLIDVWTKSFDMTEIGSPCAIRIVEYECLKTWGVTGKATVKAGDCNYPRVKFAF